MMEFLSADSFSSALLVASSKGEGGERENCSIHVSAVTIHLGLESSHKP